MNTANFIDLKWSVPVSDKAYSFGISSDRIKSINNEIYFTADVDGYSIEQLIREFHIVIQNLNKTNTNGLNVNKDKKKIILYIDSPGGTLKDCFKFVDFIDIIKRVHNVHLVTVCTGMVASAATIMAIVGDERYVTENVTCMIHELFGGTIGTYTQLSSGMKRLSIYHDKLINIYLSHNKNISRNKIIDLLKNETWFTSKEYIENGFADDIYIKNEEVDDSYSDIEKYEKPRKRRHIRYSE